MCYCKMRTTRDCRQVRQISAGYAIANVRCYWAVLTSAIGMPFRAVIRKYYSTRVETGPVPVFIVRCAEDMNCGWNLFSDSLRILEKYGSVWVQRLPRLFRSI